MKDNEIMVERGEKNTCHQVFTTFNELPKATRILDNKKVFYKGSQKYCRDRDFARILLCNFIWYFLVLLTLNHWFYWVLECQLIFYLQCLFLSWIQQHPSAIWQLRFSLNHQLILPINFVASLFLIFAGWYQ